MKSITLFALMMGFGFSLTSPAYAHPHSQTINEADAPLVGMYRSPRFCFKALANTIEVPYNLTQKQEDFIKVARFSSPEALENYIVINSINNTFRSCLKRSSKVPGFTRKATNYLGYTYYSTKTNVTLINGNNKKVIQGAVEVEVRYKRNGTISIDAKRTA
jgi:hypothetical protein